MAKSVGIGTFWDYLDYNTAYERYERERENESESWKE